MPNTQPWVSDAFSRDILAYVQIAYPIILLLLYLITFTVQSVVTAPKTEELPPQHPPQLGPGGKPLPKKTVPETSKKPEVTFSRSRKLLFEWLSLSVIGTIVANIVVVIAHTIKERDEEWWCGQAPTVWTSSHFVVGLQS